jgi:hypothetical protein
LQNLVTDQCSCQPVKITTIADQNLDLTDVLLLQEIEELNAIQHFHTSDIIFKWKLASSVMIKGNEST